MAAANVNDEAGAILEVLRLHPVKANRTLHCLRGGGTVVASCAEAPRLGITFANGIEHFAIEPYAVAFRTSGEERFTGLDRRQRNVTSRTTGSPAPDISER